MYPVEVLHRRLVVLLVLLLRSFLLLDVICPFIRLRSGAAAAAFRPLPVEITGILLVAVAVVVRRRRGISCSPGARRQRGTHPALRIGLGDRRHALRVPLLLLLLELLLLMLLLLLLLLMLAMRRNAVVRRVQIWSGGRWTKAKWWGALECLHGGDVAPSTEGHVPATGMFSGMMWLADVREFQRGA